MRRHVLGITGGVGTGKSTVLSYLREAYGAAVFACDAIARQLQQPGGACYAPMRALFGDAYLTGDGSFDRAALAGVVFADPALLSSLNAIVHPAVKEAVAAGVGAIGKDQLAVVEAALLIEGGYDQICDEIWFVRTSKEVRIRRLIKSRGYSRERAEAMMNAQKTDAFYLAHSAFVIDNDRDDLKTLYRQIDEGLTEHGFLYHSQRQQR